MKTKVTSKLSKFGSLIAMPAVFLIGIVACSDNNFDNTLSERPRTYQYFRIIPNESGTTKLVLDSLKSEVLSIIGVPSWCNVEQDGTTEQGNPVLKLTHSGSEPNEARANAKSTITMKDGNIVELTISQPLFVVNDDNDSDKNDAFLTDWEEQKSVWILSDSKGSSPVSKEVSTPWADATFTTIPEEIISDVKKEDGWEMAFCMLNTPMLANANYFGLYNRFLGILRVFYYLEDTGGSGSDVLFEVGMGSTRSDDIHTPYYNSLQYAIPVGAKIDKDKGAQAVGNNAPRGFVTYCTPYTTSKSSTLKVGWTAFDIDMSGFNSSDFLNSSNKTGMNINCYTWSDAAIKLNGMLEANMSGEYDEPYKTTTTGRVGTIVNAIKTGGKAAKGLSSFASTIEKKLQKSNDKKGDGDKKNSPSSRATVSGVLSTISSIIDIGTQIFDAFYDDKSTTYTRGKIDMSLTGTINLDGNMTQDQANSIPPLQFNKSSFLSTSTSHLGEGVWGLQESPVVYVVGDHCLGVARRGLSLYHKGEHEYDTGAQTTDLQLRMITFLDPTSLKLNLNTEAFGDVTDVDIDAYYGVYPKQQWGHTDNFRSFVNASKPAYVNILDHTKYAVGTTAYSTKSQWKMQLHLYDQNTFSSEYFGGNDQQLVSQTDKDGHIQYYYGYIENQDNNMAFMPDPQIYFPTDEQNRMVYDISMPDLVVCVTITFRANGSTYVFSRRYIPRIVEISGKDLDNKYNELANCVQKSKNAESIGALYNKSSVPVTQLMLPDYLEKNMKILKTILNK